MEGVYIEWGYMGDDQENKDAAESQACLFTYIERDDGGIVKMSSMDRCYSTES